METSTDGEGQGI